jgi:hypothetical protein
MMRPQRPVAVSVFPLVLSFTGAMQLSQSVGKEEEEPEFHAELSQLAAGRRGAATCGHVQPARASHANRQMGDL